MTSRFGKKSINVLVVSDRPDLPKILANKKAEGNFDPMMYCDCQEALSIAKKQPPFDLLITDMVPPGSDSADFAKQFLALSPKTNILYLVF